MYRFAHPEVLHWLWLIPVIVFIFWAYYRYRVRFLTTYFTPYNANLSMPALSRKKPLYKFFLFLIAWIFLFIALANPQAGTLVNKTVKTYGSDVVLIADISQSMYAEDVKPSRLKKMQQFLLNILEKSRSDRFALIPFAGNAFLQVPMTNDYKLLRNFIQLLSPSLITRQGTNIAEALRIALEAIDSSYSNVPVVILFSDGESFEGDVEEILSVYVKRKIPIHTVTIGTHGGGPIPLPTSIGTKTYKKDEAGNIIITKPNEDLMRSISKSTGGTFVGMTKLSQASEILIDVLQSAQKTQRDVIEFADYRSIFEWPLTIALLFLLLELISSDRQVKWQIKLRQFIEKKKMP
ncbi:MAG: VWA domain-containing protein [Bacteroidales bacterium]|nr:VWA domain-containing protein [Bacteroidales bacterium]